MPAHEPHRSSAARAAAELALIRIIHQYGATPEFVLLGGLVPPFLCAKSTAHHAGTVDVDVQVDLEISGGAVNAVRLEEALLAAGFVADNERIWRWSSPDGSNPGAIIKFELLADLDSEPDGSVVTFTGCQHLGAANLRGTRFAASDSELRTLSAYDKDGAVQRAEVNVAGLAGFLLAKTAAAYGRRLPKDWYDLAFVLLHNDHGDARLAATRVREVFGRVTPTTRTQLSDLRANFDAHDAQGVAAYVSQVSLDHPELDLPPQPGTASWPSSHSATHCFQTRSDDNPCGRLPADSPTPWSRRYMWRSLRGSSPGRGDTGVHVRRSASSE